MRIIYKYQLLVMNQMQALELPEGAEIIHVHEQHGDLCIWADQYTENKPVMRNFHVFATGQPFPEGICYVYRGTVHFRQGTVWHLYEVMGNPPIEGQLAAGQLTQEANHGYHGD